MVMALWLWLWRQVECQTISAIPWHWEDLELTICFGDVLYGIIADFIAVQLEVSERQTGVMCHVACAMWLFITACMQITASRQTPSSMER